MWFLSCREAMADWVSVTARASLLWQWSIPFLVARWSRAFLLREDLMAIPWPSTFRAVCIAGETVSQSATCMIIYQAKLFLCFILIQEICHHSRIIHVISMFLPHGRKVWHNYVWQIDFYDSVCNSVQKDINMVCNKGIFFCCTTPSQSSKLANYV